MSFSSRKTGIKSGVLYDDGDGQHRVIEWRVYYRHRSFCSCAGDSVDDLPATGVQGINWYILKDGQVRCHLENGSADDPTIYRIGGRKLVGTMLPDAEFFSLERRMMNAAVRRVKQLRG